MFVNVDDNVGHENTSMVNFHFSCIAKIVIYIKLSYSNILSVNFYQVICKTIIYFSLSNIEMTTYQYEFSQVTLDLELLN